MNPTKDEKIKLEIILQAQKLFQQFGLKKTTMDEIALACGKAKSTIYHYFKSKDEVFDEVLMFELRNLRKYVKAKVDEQRGIINKLNAYILEFHVEVCNKINLYRVVKHQLLSSEKSSTYFEWVFDFEKSYIKRIFEDGFDAGELHSIDSKDIPLISELLLAGFFGVVRYSIEKNGVMDNEKLKEITKILIPKIFG